MKPLRNGFCVLLAAVSIVDAALAIEFATIDRRIRSESTDYRVSFCARESPGLKIFPTHAYVVLSRFDGTGKLLELDAVGWMPVGDTKYTIESVLGYFKPELQTPKSQVCLPVLVNSDLYAKVKKLRKSAPLTRKDPKVEDVFQAPVYLTYRMTERDCLTFIIDVAKALGLKTPPRGTLRPIDYVPKLYAANKP